MLGGAVIRGAAVQASPARVSVVWTPVGRGCNEILGKLTCVGAGAFTANLDAGLFAGNSITASIAHDATGGGLASISFDSDTFALTGAEPETVTEQWVDHSHVYQVTIQFTALTGGFVDAPSFYGSVVPCPSGLVYVSIGGGCLAPTATPTSTDTPTGTPMPTNTVPPGSTNTNTPAATNTASATPVPGPTAINCGDPSFPVLNCNAVGHTAGGTNWPAHWVPTCGGCFDIPGSTDPAMEDGQQAMLSGGLPPFNSSPVPDAAWMEGYAGGGNASQLVTAHVSGTLWFQARDNGIVSQPAVYLETSGGSSLCGANVFSGTMTWYSLCSVVAGTSYLVVPVSVSAGAWYLDLNSFTVVVGAGTPVPTDTPLPTATPTGTLLPTFTATPTATVNTLATVIAQATESAGCPPGTQGPQCLVWPAATETVTEASSCNWWDAACLVEPRNVQGDLAPAVSAAETAVPGTDQTAVAGWVSIAGPDSRTCSPLVDTGVVTGFTGSGIHGTGAITTAVELNPCGAFPEATSWFGLIRDVATWWTYLVFLTYIVRWLGRAFGARHPAEEDVSDN